ncbi:ATP-dependent DNA helicase, partial [Vibrio parahaemolyticus]|nr:ATP-dependent DNA helicase [Vibrio parahaemolyticus]
INGNISTRFKDRLETYPQITETIYNFVKAKKGNYIVFFPSYAYLNTVYDDFNSKYPDLYTMKEESSLTKKQREEFLNNFTLNNDMISFCVLGGSFSEGIDLVGDKLIGAVIV